MAIFLKLGILEEIAVRVLRANILKVAHVSFEHLEGNQYLLYLDRICLPVQLLHGMPLRQDFQSGG